MLLGNYFNNINQNYKNFYFSGISFDTKNIKKSNIFFAIKGNKVDGNKFISNAIQKGSKIIVTEEQVKPFTKWNFIYSYKEYKKIIS
jgi:murE/murF fusion protein